MNKVTDSASIWDILTWIATIIRFIVALLGGLG